MLHCIATLLLATLCLSSAANPSAKLDSGSIIGSYIGNLSVFQGIPFAAPPVGANRFRAPQPVQSWYIPKLTVLAAPGCPQMGFSTGVFSEDCLYANVYTPTNAVGPLPVFVFIYGGGYKFGDGYEFGLYDGKNLVEKHGYVLVTFNYRLGALGFMTLDELRAEDPNQSSGNYALQDQTFLLQWVQRNIAAFGGDPNRVTIGGESAGAFSVCFHLASQASQGLFHAAIMESGTCEAPEFFIPYQDKVSFSKYYAQQVGCPYDQNILSCLRGLNATQMITAKVQPSSNGTINGYYIPLLAPYMPWGPTIDGSSTGLYDIPLRLIRQGKWNNVPTILGFNHDEGTLFMKMLYEVVPGLNNPIQYDQVPLVLLHFFMQNQTSVDRILQTYPLNNYPNVETMVAQILRDAFFTCAGRRTLTAMFGTGQRSIFMYHNAYKGDWIDTSLYGVYHASELPFVFANEFPPVLHKFSPDDAYVADQIWGKYWSNMVYYQNPNGPSGNSWPAYDLDQKLNALFNIPVSVESDYIGHLCDVWDSIPQYN